LEYVLNLDFGLFSTILVYIQFLHQSFSIIITKLSPFALDLEIVRYIVLLSMMGYNLKNFVIHPLEFVAVKSEPYFFKHNVTHLFSF